MWVWFARRGFANAASFLFAILAPPSPTILGFFPTKGRSSESNMISVTVGHVSLSTQLWDFSNGAAMMMLTSPRACTASPVSIEMEALKMVNGDSMSGVTFSVYWGYPADFSGCSGSVCGSLVTEVTGSVAAQVGANANYLIVATLDGYYSAYYELSLDDKGPSEPISIRMVATMLTNQDRVVLSWGFGDDLDLWVFDKNVRSNAVGYSKRVDNFAGGQITLDVDVQDGPGVETTQFRNLASGAVEVWVDHYSGQFTQTLVSDTPATVDIFCYRCTDDNGEVKAGLVTSITQKAINVPGGGSKWWKVGEFTAPGPTERVKWTSCTTNCFISSNTLSLRSVAKPPRGSDAATLRRKKVMTSPSSSGKVRVRTTGSCLSPYTLRALELVNLTAPTCTSTFCSLFGLKLEVPVLTQEDQLAGGTGNIVFTRHSGLSFEFAFRAAGSPSLELVEPARQKLMHQGVNPITFYLMNFPSSSCKFSADCAQEARFGGLSVMFGERAGTVVRMMDINQMLQVEVLGPRTGVAGSSRIVLQGQNYYQETLMVMYEMYFVAPSPILKPVDGAMAGGDIVNISVIGWGGRTFAVEDLQVQFGSSSGQVVSVTNIQSPPKVHVTVRTPPATQAGAYTGVIATTDGSYSASFVFEYFATPTIESVLPSQATLSGTTVSEDGKSILVVLKNFPFFSTAGEVQIKFGNIECDGIVCAVMSIQPSMHKIFLKLRVPARTVAGKVQFSVKYCGQAAPPQGGDPSLVYARALKQVQTSFMYFQPAPLVMSAHWCSECNSGRVCLVMGRCKAGAAPLKGKAPITNTTAGRLIVVVKNMPFVPFDPATGSIQDQTLVSLTLGSGFGLFWRVAFSDGTMLALEFSLQTVRAASAPDASATLAVKQSSGAILSAPFTFSRFNADLKLVCLTNCAGATIGGGVDHMFATNIPISFEASLLDQVALSFGETAASEIREIDVVEIPDAEVALLYADWLILKVRSPPFAGVTTRGKNSVTVKVNLKNQISTGAVFFGFAYFSAPKMVSATMDASGTVIKVLFDQDTNRAGMSASVSDCAMVLHESSIEQLGQDASCIWNSHDSMWIYLGTGASAVPGSGPGIRLAVHILKSRDLMSTYATGYPTGGAETPILAPEIPQAPIFSVMGPETIDPCAELKITASYSSPRPLTFEWGCMNDEGLRRAIMTRDGSTLHLSSGTQEMAVLNKEYQITVRATNFLGATSGILVFTVLKKGSPAPEVTFYPPVLSLYRDEETLITALAQFSVCPLPTGRMEFTWSQISGPEIDTAYFGSGAQFGLPSGVLSAGETYVIQARISMAGDPAISSSKDYRITVLHKPLIAGISGGTTMTVSSSLPFSLDASMSHDPDAPFTPDPRLNFHWSCEIFEGPCLTTLGQIVTLGTGPMTTVRANSLAPTFDTPYTFTVEVSKQGKAPVSWHMPVFISEGEVPRVLVGAHHGMMQSNGAIKFNVNGEFMLVGSCQSGAPLVDISFAPENMVTGGVLSGVKYEMYSDYDSWTPGCADGDGSCGTLVTTSDTSSSGENTLSVRGMVQGGWYLIVARLSGYYTAYYTYYIDVDGGEFMVGMVEEMLVNQDRVVLTWGHDNDLDLWAYSTTSGGTNVGWSTPGRTGTIAGGQVTLDVDNWNGNSGPETTRFENLGSGSVDIWVHHYDDVYTAAQVGEYPATVNIYCYRCFDDKNQVKVGHVTSVTQSTQGMPSGKNWWKVGTFVAPAGPERVKWMTCAQDCWVNDWGYRAKMPSKPQRVEVPANLRKTAAAGRAQSASNPNRLRSECADCQTGVSSTVEWTFSPPLQIAQADFSAEFFYLPSAQGFFVPGNSYTARFTCSHGSDVNYAELQLESNAPPRGPPCTVCNTVDETQCLKKGTPIFDTFRISCANWADADSPLEYQFGYAGTFDGEYQEVLLAWSTRSFADLSFPSGSISLKSRVRDSLGAVSAWMQDSLSIFSSIPLSFSIHHALSGQPVLGATFAVHTGFTSVLECLMYQGACGDLLFSGDVPIDGIEFETKGAYLITVEASGFYRFAAIVNADKQPIRLIVPMVSELSAGQDRVLLKWGSTSDLDLWVDAKFEVQPAIGFARSSAYIGYMNKIVNYGDSLIALDVDNQDGTIGPETTRFEKLTDGTFEVWVHHYDFRFTAEEAAATPASVDVFCAECTVGDVPESCYVGDDPDWFVTKSETFEDGRDNTTDTWSAKCSWVVSGDLLDLCHTPKGLMRDGITYGWPLPEVVREKCPVACGLCDAKSGYATTVSQVVSDLPSRGAVWWKVGEFVRTAAGTHWNTCTSGCYTEKRQVRFYVAAFDALSGNQLAGAVYNVYSGYPVSYADCEFSNTCGNRVATGAAGNTDELPAVAAGSTYLIAVQLSGYYTWYFTSYVGYLGGARSDVNMVPSLLPGQDRLVLSWDFTDDLDLSVVAYPREGVAKLVYHYEPSVDVGVSTKIALDVDSQNGQDGPEAVKLQSLDSTGVYEVWVEHFNNKFTKAIVGVSPASLAVYCDNCVDEEGTARSGLLIKIVQSEGDVLEGGAKFWKVGHWVPYASDQLQWQTCRKNCYWGYRTARVNIGAFELTQARNEIEGSTFRLYSITCDSDHVHDAALPHACGSYARFIDCEETTPSQSCGAVASEGTVGQTAFVEPYHHYLGVVEKEGFYKGYFTAWVGLSASSYSNMVPTLPSSTNRVVLKWDADDDLDLWVKAQLNSGTTDRVGWENEKFSEGGVSLSLDLDSQNGKFGAETMTFVGLEQGTFEVWIDAQYTDIRKFTRANVAQTPAYIDVFCAACLGTSGTMPRMGLVTSITQVAATVPADGAQWWNVGMWKAPSDPGPWSSMIGLQWKTCLINCYSDAGPSSRRSLPASDKPTKALQAPLFSRFQHFVRQQALDSSNVAAGKRIETTPKIVSIRKSSAVERVSLDSTVEIPKAFGQEVTAPKLDKMFKFTSASATSQRRKLLQTLGDDEWTVQAKELIRSALERGAYGEINSNAGALALEIDARFVSDLAGIDSSSNAKEYILGKLSEAVRSAIKNEDYVSEVLASSQALGANSMLLNPLSVSHLSEIVKNVVSVGTIQSLSSGCIESALAVMSRKLDATARSQCSLEPESARRNTASARNATTLEPELFRKILDNLEFSVAHLSQKAASRLITGQTMNLVAGNMSRYSVSKLSPRALLGVERQATAATGDSEHTVSYTLPSTLLDEVRALQGSTELTVNFGSFHRAPEVPGFLPVSPLVSLSVARDDIEIPVSGLVDEMIVVSLPVVNQKACGAGRSPESYSGFRCMYYSNGTYHADGCGTVWPGGPNRDDASVVSCLCSHLTSFVITEAEITPTSCPRDASMPDNLPQDAAAENCQCNKGYTGPNNGVCSACVAGTYKDVQGTTTCVGCSRGKYSNVVGATTANTCVNCVSGKFSNMEQAISQVTCQSCPAGKYSGTVAAGNESFCQRCETGKHSSTQGATTINTCTACNGQATTESQGSSFLSACKCNAGYFGPDGGGCSQCAEGKYKSSLGSGGSNGCPGVCPTNAGSLLGSDDISDCMCNAGYTGNAGQVGGTCTTCTAGKFKNARGNISCTTCPIGSATQLQASIQLSDCICIPGYLGSGGSSCLACVPGKYSFTTAASICTLCVAGKYSATQAATSINSCLSCGEGKYGLNPGANSATACLSCQPGKYLAAVGSTSESACAPCSAGKYSAGVAVTTEADCFFCPTGTQSAKGSDSIEDCTTACPAGLTGPDGSCTSCAAGTYKKIAGPSPCLSCPANAWSVDASAACKCNAGFGGFSGVCTQCSAGTFKAGGCNIANNAGCSNTGDGNCTFCGAGKYQDVVRATYCYDCPSGTFYAGIGASTNLCENCPADSSPSDDKSMCMCRPGFSSSEDSGVLVCTACGAGKYQSVAGATACTDCGAGKYSSETSASDFAVCQNCLAGKYASDRGATSEIVCTNCSAGTWSDMAGASSINSCENCGAGKYSTEQAASTTDACTNCVAGKYSSDVNADSEGHCRDCGVGKKSTAQGAQSEGTCVMCLAGQYATAGSTACTSCEAGTYSTNAGPQDLAESCNACQTGKYAGAQASVCTSCEAGKYGGSDVTRAETCQDCAAGKFSLEKAATAQSTCRQCVIGKYSNMASSSCTDCDAGTYSAEAGASTRDVCTACNSNANSPAGSSNITSCVCNPGYSGPNGGQCVACKAGKTNPLGGSVPCENITVTPPPVPSKLVLPTATPKGSKHTGYVEVALATSEGSLRYTADGTAPKCADKALGTKATVTLSVKNKELTTYTLKAMSCSDWRSSEVMSEIYQVDPGSMVVVSFVIEGDVSAADISGDKKVAFVNSFADALGLDPERIADVTITDARRKLLAVNVVLGIVAQSDAEASSLSAAVQNADLSSVTASAGIPGARIGAIVVAIEKAGRPVVVETTPAPEDKKFHVLPVALGVVGAAIFMGLVVAGYMVIQNKSKPPAKFETTYLSSGDSKETTETSRKIVADTPKSPAPVAVSSESLVERFRTNRSPMSPHTGLATTTATPSAATWHAGAMGSKNESTPSMPAGAGLSLNTLISSTHAPPQTSDWMAATTPPGTPPGEPPEPFDDSPASEAYVRGELVFAENLNQAKTSAAGAVAAFNQVLPWQPDTHAAGAGTAHPEQALLGGQPARDMREQLGTSMDRWYHHDLDSDDMEQTSQPQYSNNEVPQVSNELLRAASQRPSTNQDSLAATTMDDFQNTNGSAFALSCARLPSRDPNRLVAMESAPPFQSFSPNVFDSSRMQSQVGDEGEHYDESLEI